MLNMQNIEEFVIPSSPEEANALLSGGDWKVISLSPVTLAKDRKAAQRKAG